MKKTITAIVFLMLATILFAEAAKNSSLFMDTITADIETSDYYELTTWCNRLGLNNSGSADELRKRLLKHYKKESDVVETETRMQHITIESADNLDYFKIEKVDENYVRITGNVIITIDKTRGSDGGEQHKIKADSVLFNFKENYLTAEGNIEYVLEGETKTENFRGDKITFNIDTEEGLFDKGITEQEQEIDENEITFYFKGDQINKTKENYVLLENGEITSCDFDDPHYKIKAKKLWLLASNEWAVLNGLVYIGRVPIFYIPAFLYAGDDIFINPSFGYRNDSGYYMHTTTYFIGEKKEDEDSAFSFMQSETENKYYKREGLFLTEDKNPTASSKALQDYGGTESNYIKLILDYYTTLGFYSALDLKLGVPPGDMKIGSIAESIFSFLSVIENADLFISIARTRKVEQTETSYTYLFPDEKGKYSSIWEKSYLFDFPIPFRYGLDFDSGIDVSWLKIDFTVDLWSDRDYKIDFSERSENLDLLSLLSLDTESEETTASEVTTGNVNFSAEFSPDIKILNPWITSLNVKTESYYNLLSKEIDNSNGDFDEFVDYFFYPDSRMMPDISGKIGGTLLPLNLKTDNEKSGAEKKSSDKKIELKSPLENREEQYENNNEEENIHAAMADINIITEDFWQASDVFSNKMTYSVSPDFSDKNQLNNDEWEDPLDIDMQDIEYSFQTATVNGALDYSANIFENLISLKNNVKINWGYNKHYNMDELEEETISQYLLEDKQSTEMKMLNNLQLSTCPLAYNEVLENFKFTYNFNSIIYEYDYNPESEVFAGTFIEFSDDYITSHKLGVIMPLEFGDFSQSLTLNTTLPPLNFTADGSLKIDYKISSSEFNTSMTQDEETWTYEPLTFNEKLTFNDNLWLSNSISYNYSDSYFEQNILSGEVTFLDGKISAESQMIYDVENEKFSKFKSQLNIFDLLISYTAEDTYDYFFDSETGWEQAEQKSFIPSLFTTRLNISPEPMLFWKNRNNLEYTVDTNLNMNLIRFTDSSLTFSLSFNFSIFEFLTLDFSSTSENSAVFRYFPSYCSEVGVNNLSFFGDLIKSFNFFKIDDRYESNFNLKTISIGFTHDLHDWDLKVEYSGSPFVNDEEDYPFYDWESKLNIYLAWKAIPDIKTDMKIDNEDISF